MTCLNIKTSNQEWSWKKLLWTLKLLEFTPAIIGGNFIHYIILVPFMRFLLTVIFLFKVHKGKEILLFRINKMVVPLQIITIIIITTSKSNPSISNNIYKSNNYRMKIITIIMNKSKITRILIFSRKKLQNNMKIK